MKKVIPLLLACWLSGSYLTPNCRADDIDLEKIVVTPSGEEESICDITRKVNVITAKDIEGSSANDLSGLLSEFTSANVSSYGGPGASKNIRMRGSTAAQTLVLIDGRPINSPRDGEADLSSIPLDNIERVELMHGPGSSLYGAGAMGGAVNIITKNPPKEKQKTEFSTSFGTFRTYIERLSYGARVSKLGYLVSAGYESSNGARGNSQFNAKDFNAKLEYELNGNNTVSADCGFYRSRVGVPGPTSSPDEDDKQIKLKNYFGLGWNFQPDENTGISAKAYQNYDRLEFIENTAGSIFDTANSKAVHTTNVRGVDLQLNKQLCEKFRGILGFNYVANFNDSTSSGKHKYYVSAGYLENIFDLSRDLRVNFGTRVDDYSNFGTQASPSLSFMYRPTPNYKLHGSLSRSFRAPTFNDLYWPDEGWAVGNPNLKPEKCITAEIGLEAKLSKFLLSDLTYYRSNYNQLISWIPEAGVWKPQNIGSAVIDGLELENSLSLSQDLMLRISYTYLRARDDKAHEYLIYQPKNKADFSLKYSGPNGLAIEFKGQFTDTRFHDADNTIKVKRFFVLGLNASKQIKQWLTCYMSIDNLLNERYQAIRDYPMPGFSLTTGVKLEF